MSTSKPSRRPEADETGRDKPKAVTKAELGAEAGKELAGKPAPSEGADKPKAKAEMPTREDIEAAYNGIKPEDIPDNEYGDYYRAVLEIANKPGNEKLKPILSTLLVMLFLFSKIREIIPEDVDEPPAPEEPKVSARFTEGQQQLIDNPKPLDLAEIKAKGLERSVAFVTSSWGDGFQDIKTPRGLFIRLENAPKSFSKKTYTELASEGKWRERTILFFNMLDQDGKMVSVPAVVRGGAFSLHNPKTGKDETWQFADLGKKECPLGPGIITGIFELLTKDEKNINALDEAKEKTKAEMEKAKEDYERLKAKADEAGKAMDKLEKNLFKSRREESDLEIAGANYR